ncbi:hypothetical protein KSP40_PGU008267 [Platanthera guangdongensis]|uniref:BZIP domain-containing protein n=1 Tax=Platanthera guangdongensis TaxID=2320717 RepID=A0ABR2MWY2_9ASPA
MEEELLLDLRKRKRMLSNRESARRSRMRKQQHSENLVSQAAQLREANRRISAQVKMIAERCGRVEAENRVIRTEAMELAERLGSVSSLLRLMGAVEISDPILNPWQLPFPAPPITASADVFQ